MAGSSVQILSSFSAPVTGSAETISLSTLGRDVFSLAADTCLAYLSPEGQQISNTGGILVMRDGAEGRRVTAQGTGITVAQDTVLNGRKYFDMPGTSLAKLRLPDVAISGDYSFMTVLKTPATQDEAFAIWAGAAAVTHRFRLGDGTVYVQHGGAASPASFTWAGGPPADTEVIFWASYDASEAKMKLGINTLDAGTTQDLGAPLLVPGQDFGSYVNGGTDSDPWPEPVGLWMILDECLHDTDAATAKRKALINVMSDYYAIPVS